jgi:hypothetical protein
VIGWAALAWSAGLAIAMIVVGLTEGCGGVRPTDIDVCELDRDSTISGLALVWFIGFLPAAVAWLLARTRRARCRICGDELATGERRVCHRCAGRLVRSAAHGD